LQFKADDQDGSGFLSLEDLKRIQEKIDNPITHAQLKQMLSTVASDPEKGLSFEDFIKMQLVIKGVDPDQVEVDGVSETQKESFCFWARKVVDRQVQVEMKKLDLAKMKEAEESKLQRRESRDNFKQQFAMFGQLVTPRVLPGKQQ
jgi:EF-hand domain pair